MAAHPVAVAVAWSLMLLLVIASLPAAVGTAAGPHIADLNVLLPPRMTNPVGYRLQGTGGCFSWSWDHHDILSVHPEYNDSSRCSTSARLLSIAPYNRRKETAVYATDLHSGITIRCKVYIDKISQIQIFHHAVKIDLDELATLRIRAFDDEENVFSSLVGLQFLWKLEPKSLEDGNIHHLVHVLLKETPLSDCGGFCGDLDTQIELEDRGLGTDLYVIKGIGIGHEVVSAQLLEPQLEHVMDKIVLTVAEAMSLDPPSPVFVTVDALIYYSLRVIRLNTPQVIDLPSPHHRWSALNSSVARVDSMMGIAYALSLGVTNIVVEDIRVSGHVQTSSMHVVTPDKLSLYIVPLINASVSLEGIKPSSSSAIWYVFPGPEYIVHMKVFSQGPDAHEIHITENNDLKLESSPVKYWDILSISDDLAVTYSWRKSRLLKPISEGQGTLTASLTYHNGNKERAGVLKVVQEVIVCTRVKIRIGEDDDSSQTIRLPWAPGVYQEFELKATGGCGKTLKDYIWFSSDEATISVSASGVVRTNGPGQAIIKLVSIFDSINADEVKLSVTGGTCFLDAVTNDTQVAEISQPPESAECLHLIVSARGLGTALVTVRDIGLSPPAAASALVKVANVDLIKIISSDTISLMEGTTKAFDILAWIHDGCVFDSSQYMYMNMHVHLEDNMLELVSKNGSSRFGGWIVSGPNFSVRAANVGITSLYVSVMQRSGNEILSQIIKVEVYKPLQVHPEYIYLAPGASYVLTVKGGPKIGAFVEYASMHEETAVVQRSSGRISAISIGNATVRAAVFGNGGSLICEAYGRVQVGIPSAMILNLQSEQLCIGCKMPIFPSFPEGNLFSFYEVCKDYKWTVENEKVLSFQTARSLHSNAYKIPLSCAEGNNNSYCSENNDCGFIDVLVGRSAGRTKVSIWLSCDFVSSGTAPPTSYIASETLTVVSDPPLALGMPITWILPPFYTTSDLLPGSSDSDGQFHLGDHKKSTTYSVLKTCGKNDASELDAIAIDGHKIRTRESNELACIQAKDQTTRRTEIASCVRVAEVAQVRVTTLESSFRVAYLAMHAKLELVISFCDNLGYPFSEAHGVVPLDVETNYPDVVSIVMPKSENMIDGVYGNVFLQAKSPGRALVMITINHDSKKADFILVSVGAQLYPQNPIMHVGHHLNFTIVGDGLDGLGSAQWLSGNESILSVNRISGEAHASAEGAAQVIFEGSNFKLQTTVSVLKVDQVIVDAPAETLTNMPFPSNGYKFPVKFSHPYDYKSEAIGSVIEVPYDCKVDPPFIGYAKPWSDHGTGNSYCLFFPYSPKHLLSSLSESKATKSEGSSSSEHLMYVSVIASLREAPYTMGFAHALFVGGFSIEELRKVLNLTPSSNKSLITIIGNTEVEIYWNSKDLLQVTPLTRDGFGIGALVKYEVKVLKDQRFTDKLIILLPATGQRMEIDVNYYEHGERTGPAGMSGNMWSGIAICAAVLIMTVVIFIRLLDKPDRSTTPSLSRQRFHVSSSTVAGPLVTPDHSTSAAAAAAAANTQSSPQPFIEYVRRTIDETPYYKRDGRRRFDPQYTY